MAYDLSQIEHTFHEAIRSGDVAARLIYADWLEEQGRLVECGMLRSGKWCLVPAGTFWMGGGWGMPGERQVEIPSAFYLGAYQVTQGEWQAVMGNNPSYFSRNGEGGAKIKRISDAELAEFPVEQVSWNDVQEYIRKLNELEQANFWVNCLPTEAGWEYACRGAAASRELCSFDYYLNYPTNNLSITQANFWGPPNPITGEQDSRNLERPTVVGSYQPNCLGLFDMHGNVLEWCQARYKNREEESIVGQCGTSIVVRGGSWANIADNCRAADRQMYGSHFRDGSIGFRLARVPAV